MRVILAGGRHRELSVSDVELCVKVCSAWGATEIVSGACKTGVDSYASVVARHLGLHLEQFPADWDRYGRGAGPVRNKQMAVYAGALIAFAGGDGTQNMWANAENENLLRMWVP